MGAYNDDVLFIHIPKTGGTAVKHYMAKHLPDVKWPDPKDIGSIVESGLPIGHIPLRDIPQFVNRPIDSWEKIIGVIRDPYQHQVSQWWFWHTRFAEGDWHPNSVHAGLHPKIHSWLKSPDSDFHIWYEHRFHPGSELVRKPPSAVTSYADWGGYYWYWLSVDGVIPPNVTIIKQEDLSHQLPLALAPYIDGPLPPVPTKNKGATINWRKAYTSSGPEVGARSMDIVTYKFRWCIEAGHYPRQEVTT